MCVFLVIYLEVLLIKSLPCWFVPCATQILLTEARVLGLGPRFMSIYVPQLSVSSSLASVHFYLLSFYNSFLNVICNAT